jgi:predicted O-methyltransferase YrrM
MLAGLTCRTRDPHMRRAIQMLIDQKRKNGGKEEIRVLEIGSWSGQSAILWAQEIVRSGYPGKVYCVDPWMPFSHPDAIGVNNATELMDNVARRDKIFPLFWHNVKSSGLTDIVFPLRCKSNDILPHLKPGSFDLVFVDGAHTFSQFLSDLTLAAPLVRQSGVICGDDLALSIPEKNREKDFITDPRTQLEYHPGVCLGVSSFFKHKVSTYDGFWIAKKNADHWTDVQIY